MSRETRNRAKVALIAAVAGLGFAGSSHGASGTWTYDGDASWTDVTSAPWLSGRVPDGASDVAEFSTIDWTADRTVTVNAPITVQKLVFGDTNGQTNLTLSGSPTNSITIAGGQRIQVKSGSVTFTGDIKSTGGATFSAAIAGGNQTAQPIGRGTAVFSGGTASFAGTVTIADMKNKNTGGETFVVTVKDNANFLVTGASNNLQLGWISSKGTLNVVSGTVSVGGNIIMANPQTPTVTAGSGTVTISGGTVTCATLQFTSTGSTTAGQLATVNLNGGVIQAKTVTAGNQQANDTNNTSFNLNGGTLRAAQSGNLSVSTQASTNVRYLAKANGETIDTQGYDVTFGGRLQNSGNGALTKLGGGTLTMLHTNNDYAGGTNVNEGTLRIAGKLTSTAAATVTVNSGGTMIVSSGGTVATPTIAVNSGGILTTDGALTGIGNTTIDGAMTINATGSSASALITVNSGGTLTATSSNITGGLSVGGLANISTGLTTSGGTANVLTSLSFTGSGTLDLNKSSLIVHAAADPTGILADLTANAATGINGGNWNGTGIISTNAQTTTNLTAVGMIVNDDGTGISTPLYNTFGGQTGLGVTDVLLKYTYYGDANLDGTIDAIDYQMMDGHKTGANARWQYGDFNYDGSVNASDYMLIDAALCITGTNGPLAASLIQQHAAMFGNDYAAQVAALVPEPACLAWVLCGTGLLLRRARSRNSK